MRIPIRNETRQIIGIHFADILPLFRFFIVQRVDVYLRERDTKLRNKEGVLDYISKSLRNMGDFDSSIGFLFWARCLGLSKLGSY